MTMQTSQRRTQWWRIPYYDDPDFSKIPEDLTEEQKERILDKLRVLYPDIIARNTLEEVVRLIRVHRSHRPPELVEEEKHADPEKRFSEQDMMLITYGDMVRAAEETGLSALNAFLSAYRKGDPVFSIVHVLPFFPYTSDRGFSVLDFRSVDPNLGTWEDIKVMGDQFRLMFDGVLNHASSRSAPFQQMLSGNMEYADYAVSFSSPDDLTDEQRKVLRRPRTSDVLTQFHSIDGPVWVWTTFSPDQIDLNYRNPRVLLSSLDTLLFYVRMGADLVRLDAVTYIWKELGTSSASLEETHAIVKLFRDVLDYAAPQVMLVTETNVPHAENTSYFGNGYDEAQVVYNFALPPLVLHAFYSGDSHWLSSWAAKLEYPSPCVTYLNMLDTHDGIGLMGAAEILPRAEIDFLVKKAREHGAFISNRTSGDKEEPYEVNCTWYSALNLETHDESLDLQVQRFVASRSIALALKGIPAVYLHSLNGTVNDVRLALQTHVKRDVNRSTLDYEELLLNLAKPGSKLHVIAEKQGRLFRTRVMQKAFHPNGGQKVLQPSNAVFAVLRTSPAGDEHVLCVTNVANVCLEIQLRSTELELDCENWFDLLAGRGWMTSGGTLRLYLQPYDVLWLTPYRELESRIENGH
jgi:glucosylglycerate phosphorylase